MDAYLCWACSICGWTPRSGDARNDNELVRAHEARIQAEEQLTAEVFIRATLRLAEDFYQQRARELPN
jgi:hypothetical protein